MQFSAVNAVKYSLILIHIFISQFVAKQCRRRRTSVTRCITSNRPSIALYKKLDAECDQQVTVVGSLLTALGHVHRREMLSTSKRVMAKVWKYVRK